MASQDSSLTRPRFSISISGPSTFSLASGTYPLTTTLHYHASAFSQPITFNILGTPIDHYASLLGSYIFYHTDAERDGRAAETYPIDLELNDEAVPVSAENNFATVSSQGEDFVQRQLDLSAEQYDLGVGCKYRLCLPSGIITWWEYGPMMAFKDVTVRPTQMRHDTGLEVIEIPASNSIEVTVTE
ncbi:MAG: hypothetical protein Q9220_007286 [cf. Caloplaca sp. 1 TL-2023]